MSVIKLYSIWVSQPTRLLAKTARVSIHYACDLLRSRAHRIKLGNSVQLRKDAIINVIAPPEQNGEVIIVADDDTVAFEAFPHSVIFGNPATVIKHFDAMRNAWLRGCAEAWRESES